MANHEPTTLGTRVLGVVFGLVILGASLMCMVVSVKSHDAAEVECGNQIMEADDTCITFGEGGSTQRSLEEQQALNNRVDWGNVVGGVIGIIVGALMIIASFSADVDGPQKAASPVRQRPPQRNPPRTPPGGAPPPRPVPQRGSPRSKVEPARTRAEPPVPPKPPNPARTVSLYNFREGVEIAAGLTGLAVKRSWRAGAGPDHQGSPSFLAWHEIAALEFDRGAVALYALRADGGPRERLGEATLFSPASWSKLGRAIEEKTDGRLGIDTKGLGDIERHC